MSDDISEAGAVLHRVTRANIVRTPILVGGVLFLVVFVAFFLVGQPFDPRNLLAVLLLPAAVGSIFAFPLGMRWLFPQIVSVHEHGVVVARRGARFFVPWASVTRIEQRTILVNGVQMLQYVVLGGPYPVPIVPNTIGAALADGMLEEIVRRAGLVWASDGNASRA